VAHVPFLTGEDVVWVVAPHADDEILGAGGLLLQAKRAGAQIHILYVTVSGFKTVRGGADTDSKTRRQEVRSVTNSLEVAAYDILYQGEEQHLKLDTLPLADLVEWLERTSACALAQVRPTVALLPSPKHNHQDHRAVYRAGLAALRSNPANERHRQCALAYEIPGSGQLGLPGFDPNVYLELTASEVEEKCGLFSHYVSQVSSGPSLRSPYAIKTLAQYRGLECGYTGAEAFELLRLKVRHGRE
jgi:N-acetylglucosamine malate deacetylase 1